MEIIAAETREGASITETPFVVTLIFLLTTQHVRGHEIEVCMATQTMDAIALLKADHDKVESLFQRCHGLDDQHPDKLALARQICLELKVHATIEEEVFYPVAQRTLTGKDARLVSEARNEHQQMTELIERLLTLQASVAPYDSTLQELHTAVEHHVHKEEHELFPLITRLGAQLQQLGDQLQRRKEQLMGSMKPEMHMEPAQGA
jgi:iron-sulfur cluster repair protein YtfE (RIC family)